MRREEKKNLYKTGVFFSLVCVVLFVMVASIGKESSLFDTKTKIRGRLANVSNLKTGSYVEFKGIRIGTVTDIRIISLEEVEVEMTVLEKEIKWIKKDAKVAISNAGLVGDKFIEIVNGVETEAFKPERDILVASIPTDLTKILAKGDSIATVTERILLRLDQMLEKLDRDEKINQTFSALHRSSLNLEKITSTLAQAQLDKTLQKFNQSNEKLHQILTRIESGPGTMNSLIYDESLYEDLKALLGGAQRNKVIKYFIRESIKKSEPNP